MMSRTTQISKGTQSQRPSPITNVPPEIIREVFKLVVLSSEEARSHGVKALCLVDRYWNNVANATPDLWTKVTLTCPHHIDQLSAAEKWLKASEPRAIDVEVVFYDPYLLGLWKDDWLTDPLFRNVIELLGGSEHRWRSLSVKSDTVSPIEEFLRSCVTPGFPALESISFEGLGKCSAPANQRYTESLATFSGDGTLMPRLREMTLCDMPMGWIPAAPTPFHDLRKLVVRYNPRWGHSQAWLRFSKVLGLCHRLETLDLDYDPPAILVQRVHLPSLKHLIFRWTSAKCVRHFLEMFHIPETLETLCIFQAERAGRDTYTTYADSTPIFQLFVERGSEDLRPSDPRISMLRLKSLSVSSVHCDTTVMTSFLEKAPKIEEISLMNVSSAVAQAVEKIAKNRPLVGVYIGESSSRY
jgi:hypothetical protein